MKTFAVLAILVLLILSGCSSPNDAAKPWEKAQSPQAYSGDAEPKSSGGGYFDVLSESFIVYDANSKN